MKHSSALRYFLPLAAVLLFMALALAFALNNKSAPPLHPVAGDFGGDFTLVDQDGETVTQDDFLDSYKLIYFGFTFCPAICPTELAKISDTLLRLDERTAQKIQPIFITIDPERDTQEVMKDYISLFHPRLIGLTGTPEQIKEAAGAYKVYYAKTQSPEMSDYTMDHSSYIFFMSPGDTLLQIFKMDDSAEVMAEAIQAWLNQPL